MARNANDSVIWIINWFAVQIGYCPSRAAWEQALIDVSEGGAAEYRYAFDGAGAVEYFHDKNGAGVILVHIQADRPGGSATGRFPILSTIAHEAVHVWQYVKAHIKEDTPGTEVEAYAIEAIFTELVKACAATNGKRFGLTQ